MTPDAHVPRHQLEALATTADPAAAPEARRHLASCPSCAQRLAEIEKARAAYLAAFPADGFARQVAARAQRASREPAIEPSSRRRWFAGFGTLALAAGAIALFALRPTDEIRLKGGPASWQVVAKRGERTWPLTDGATLRPGDRLAFTYTLAQDRFFLLLGVDDGGTVSQYGGADGAPLRLARGSGPLPFAIELDERPGEERLFAVFSPAAIDGATAKRALTDAFARARAQRRAVAASDLTLAAEVLTLGFSKK
jgi:hypothetical protein